MSEEFNADFDVQEFIGVFIMDADENLALMEENLLMLEADPTNVEAIGAVFRAAHTIKGNATLVGFHELAEFAHSIETILDDIRGARRLPTRDLITLLLLSLDALRAFVVELSANPTAQFRVDAQLAARLAALENGESAPSSQDGAGAAPENAAQGATRVNRDARALRVPVDRLDLILNLTSEITIARGRERTLLQSARIADAHEAHQEADRLYSQLREEVAKLRLVPIGPVFRRLRRLVRDIAESRGKKVRVEFEGEDVELDTSIIEQLNDPLMHMVRNAVDHGIEPPAERIAAGKSETGTVRLRAFYETGIVVMRLEDDGRGLSREKIIARGIERGLITGGDQLSEQEVYSLIFEPGFSTAEVVTNLSGRGVGLDVVKRTIENMRGTIHVSSTPGAGAAMSLRLPLTVATIEGFNVEAGGETYILPLDYVLECVELPKASHATDAHGAGLMNLRGAPLPFVRLARLFNSDSSPAARESAVIVQSGETRLAIVVETLRGEGEAVIKPLGRLLGSVPGLSGSTILGSGRIGLIVDVPALIQRACPTDTRGKQ